VDDDPPTPPVEAVAMDQVLCGKHKDGRQVEVRQAHGGRKTRAARTTVYGRARARDDGVWWRKCYDCDLSGDAVPMPLVSNRQEACLEIVDHHETVHRRRLQRVYKLNPFRSY
jgi:hypothetical protein